MLLRLLCSGLCSALSPAELRAAEAAERLLEQERKDREIARRLQVSLVSLKAPQDSVSTDDVSGPTLSWRSLG